MPRQKNAEKQTKESASKAKERIGRLAPYVESVLKEKYGCYPESHPLSQYVKSIVDRMETDAERGRISVSVTRGWEEENACALPNGRILVSDRLFKFCETEEEIAFILNHERSHIKERHAEELFSGADTHDIFWEIGSMRSHEYEADVRAAIESGEGSFNPYGGVVFLNRLHEIEKKGCIGEGIIHGSSLLRVLALNYTARVVDMPSLSHALTPLPEAVLGSIESGMDPWKIVDRDSFDTSEPQKLHLMRVSAAKGCGILSALSLAGPAYKRFEGIKQMSEKAYNGASLSAQMRMKFEKEIFGILLSKIDSFINKKYADLDNEGKEVARALLLELCAGIPLSKMHLRGEDHFGLFNTFSKLILERKGYEIGKILREFSENFPEELILENSPKGLIESITAAFKENGGFGDREYSLVVNILLKELENAYCKRGIMDINWGEIEAEASVSLMGEINNRDGVPEFIAIVDSSAKNLSEEDRDKIRRALFEEGGFSTERLPEHWAIEGSEWKGEEPLQRHVEAKKALIIILGEEGPSSEREFIEVLEILKAEDLGEIEDFLDSIWQDYEIPESIKLNLAESINLEKPPDISISERSELNLAERTDLDIPFDISTYSRSKQHEKFLNALKSKKGQFGFMRIISKIPSRNGQLHCVKEMGDHLESVLSLEELLEFKELLERHGFCDTGEGKILLGTIFAKSAFGWVDALPREELFERLKKTVELLKPHEFMRAYEQDSIPKEIPSGLGYSRLLVKVLDKYSFDIDDVAEADQLLTVCAYLGDYDLKSQAIKSILIKQIPKLRAGEAKELLFRDLRLKGTSLNELREKIINEEIVVPKDLKEAIDEAIILLTKKEESKENMGKAIAGNALMDILLKNKNETLALFLKCAEDDFELRKVAYLAWENIRKYNDFTMPLSTLYGRLYNMDFLTKQLVVQNLLMGKNGALTTQLSRKETIDWILDYFVNAPENEGEKKLVEFLRGTLGKLAEKSDVSTMYFLLSPLILDRILVKPKKAMTWGEFLDRMAGEYEEMVKHEIREREREHSLEVREDVIQKEYERGLIGEDIPYIVDRDATLDSIRRDVAIGDFDCWEDSREDLENNIKIVEGLSGYLEEETGKKNGKRILKPIEFVRLVASHLGSPGVRFLQTLGLYVDLPPEYREEFDKVYDSISGQPKLSAFHTLQREWEGFNEEVAEIRAPVGGGSLLTVYEVRTTDGKKEVAKVLNPNAAFHTKSMCELMESVFETVEEHKKLAVPIIRDIETWINADVSFKNSFEKDMRFRKIHSGWKAEGSKYSIYVPTAHGEENKYYTREEFIEGKNLTQWESLIEEGHDMKDILSTVVKNSVVQLIDGQVHSDLHPGNIRITGDKRICYLDRNYYIEIDDSDKRFMLGLESSLDDKDKLAGKIVKYFSGKKNLVLQGELAKRLNTGAGDPAHLIADALVEVRNGGYDVPLKVTLILKNILSLDRLAKRAGFSGIAKAYLYENK